MSFVRFFAENLRHTGRIWVFGNALSVDAIHPARFFSLDPDRCRQGLFAGIDPALPEQVRPGDMVLAGRNFGCGSSREVYARAMVLAGVAAVAAESVARICWRNLANHGLVAISGLAGTGGLVTGDTATLDLAAGTLADAEGTVRARFTPPTPSALELLRRQSRKKDVRS
jgi:3-isopropylmalate/(R)-2-methylmalate dehydratase small subunit